VVGKADFFVLLPQRHDAVAEAQAGRAAAEFVHLERVCRPVRDVQTFAVPIRCEEHLIFPFGVNGLKVVAVQTDNGRSAH